MERVNAAMGVGVVACTCPCLCSATDLNAFTADMLELANFEPLLDKMADDDTATRGAFQDVLKALLPGADDLKKAPGHVGDTDKGSDAGDTQEAMQPALEDASQSLFSSGTEAAAPPAAGGEDAEEAPDLGKTLLGQSKAPGGPSERGLSGRDRAPRPPASSKYAQPSGTPLGLPAESADDPADAPALSEGEPLLKSPRAWDRTCAPGRSSGAVDAGPEDVLSETSAAEAELAFLAQCRCARLCRRVCATQAIAEWPGVARAPGGGLLGGFPLFVFPSGTPPWVLGNRPPHLGLFDAFLFPTPPPLRYRGLVPTPPPPLRP